MATTKWLWLGSILAAVTLVGTLHGTVRGTGGWDAFQTMRLPGTLHLPAGTSTVRVAAASMPRGAVMNLRGLTLTPAGAGQ